MISSCVKNSVRKSESSNICKVLEKSYINDAVNL